MKEDSAVLVTIILFYFNELSPNRHYFHYLSVVSGRFEHKHGIAAYFIGIISENTIGGIAKLQAITRMHLECMSSFLKCQTAFQYPYKLASREI